MRHFTFTILLILFFSGSLCAQVFSESLLAQKHVLHQGLIVPNERFVALTGYHGGIQAAANYMNRWPGILATNRYYTISSDVYLHQLNAGAGIRILHEVNNSYLKQSGLKVSLAPQLRFERGTFTLGGAYSFQRTEFDWDAFFFPPNLSDPELRQNQGELWNMEPTASFHSGSIGIGWMQTNFLLATELQLSARSPFFENSDGLKTVSFKSYIAKRFPIRTFASVTPSLSYLVMDDNYNNRYSHLIGALNIRIKNLLVGTQYRWKEEAVVQLAYDFFNTYLISYSYGLSFNDAQTATFGSHQLGLRFTFNKNHQDRALIKDLWVL